MRTIAALGLAGILCGCYSGPSAQPVDYTTTKTLHLKARVAAGELGKGSEVWAAFASTNPGRVFVNGHEVGGFRQNYSKTFKIPGNATTVELRVKDLVLDSTKSYSNMLDISSAGTDVYVVCDLTFVAAQWECELSDAAGVAD